MTIRQLHLLKKVMWCDLKPQGCYWVDLVTGLFLPNTVFKVSNFFNLDFSYFHLENHLVTNYIDWAPYTVEPSECLRHGRGSIFYFILKSLLWILNFYHVKKLTHLSIHSVLFSEHLKSNPIYLFIEKMAKSVKFHTAFSLPPCQFHAVTSKWAVTQSTANYALSVSVWSHTSYVYMDTKDWNKSLNKID